MRKYQKGQSLVLLLFFVLMAMTLAITAILMMVVASGSIVTLENGIEIRQMADSGTETALLKLVRDPSYTGETYSLGDANIEIVITGLTTKTITTTVTMGSFIRKVEVLTNYTNNVLSITSWKEKF